jgi:hypothetical protein
LYQTSNKDAGHAVAYTSTELDSWVAEEGIFLHADEFFNDEIA